MFVQRTEERIPRVESSLNRGKPRDDGSFADTMDSVLTADAVEVTYSKDEEKENAARNQLRKQRQQNSESETAEGDGASGVNITA